MVNINGYYMLMMVNNLVGGIPTPLKNHGVRQVGIWNSQQEMEKESSHVNHQPKIHGREIRVFPRLNKPWKNHAILMVSAAKNTNRPGHATCQS